jgi:hypothetical protein
MFVGRAHFQAPGPTGSVIDAGTPMVRLDVDKPAAEYFDLIAAVCLDAAHRISAGCLAAAHCVFAG